MASFYRRRSRKQFRREAQSLAPNNDVSGKNVDPFRRVLFAQYPPGRALDGRAVRRETILPVSGPAPVAGKNVDPFRRVLFAQYPPGRALCGRVVRWLPIYQDNRAPLFLRRSIHAACPPRCVLSGRTMRMGTYLMGGSGYDVFVVIGGGRPLVPTDFVPPTVGDIETRIGG